MGTGFVVDVVERERTLGALLLRLERGVAVPLFAFRDWSSGLGEEDVSCARGGGATTSLREFGCEVEEETVSLLLEPPLRKGCVAPLAAPGPRRPLSGGLIVDAVDASSHTKLLHRAFMTMDTESKVCCLDISEHTSPFCACQISIWLLRTCLGKVCRRWQLRHRFSQLQV